jgi:hypothetical protein
VAAGPTTDEERRAIAHGCAEALSIPTRWPGLMRHLPTREEAAPYLALGMSHLPEGDSIERARLLMAQGAWSWGFGEAITDPETVATDRRAAEEAVAMARRIGRPWLLSGALDTLGATGSLLDGYRGVLEPQWERLELVPQLDDVAEITDIYGVTAWGLAHQGEFRRAIEFGLKGMEVGADPGVVNYVPAGFVAVCQYRLGEWDAFWETFEQADARLDSNRSLRYHAMRMYGVGAYVREVTGDPEGADRLIERLDSSQAELGPVGVSGARSWIVAVLVRRGAYAAARERLAVIDPVRDIQNRDLTYEARADLVAREGRWEEVPELATAARAWADHNGMRFLPVIVDRLEGQAALAAGRTDEAVDRLTVSRKGFEALEATWERARTDLALSHALRAAGRMDEASEAAQAALGTFEVLGALREIEEASALIGG